jgi:tight adherence protein C
MNAILSQVVAAALSAQTALMQAAGEVSDVPLGDKPFWEMLDLWDLALCVLIFADVTMLVMAIFSQRTVVRLSPEREAAIATGHTDRKTVFETPAIRHLMWFLLNLTHRMALPRFKGWIRRRLVAAGNPDYYTPEEYLALAIASGLILGLLTGVVFLALADNFSIVSVCIGMFIGMGLTIFQVYDRSEKRVRIISKRVPYSLDLISLAMGAGATFTEAVQTVVREESVDPFNVELKTMLAEMDLGTTRRKALRNLSDRVPLESLRSIVASVIQAEELGTPLGEVLHQQASLLRLHRSVRAENAAAVASVRILVPSLLILIAVVIAIFGPAILRIVERGLF